MFYEVHAVLGPITSLLGNEHFVTNIAVSLAEREVAVGGCHM